MMISIISNIIRNLLIWIQLGVVILHFEVDDDTSLK